MIANDGEVPLMTKKTEMIEVIKEKKLKKDGDYIAAVINNVDDDKMKPKRILDVLEAVDDIELVTLGYEICGKGNKPLELDCEDDFPDLNVNDNLADIADIKLEETKPDKKGKNGCVDQGNLDLEVGDIELDMGDLNDINEMKQCEEYIDEIKGEMATEETMKELLKTEYEDSNTNVKKENTLPFEQFHSVLDEHILEMKTREKRKDSEDDEVKPQKNAKVPKAADSKKNSERDKMLNICMENAVTTVSKKTKNNTEYETEEVAAENGSKIIINLKKSKKDKAKMIKNSKGVKKQSEEINEEKDYEVEYDENGEIVEVEEIGEEDYEDYNDDDYDEEEEEEESEDEDDMPKFEAQLKKDARRPDFVHGMKVLKIIRPDMIPYEEDIALQEALIDKEDDGLDSDPEDYCIGTKVHMKIKGQPLLTSEAIEMQFGEKTLDGMTVIKEKKAVIRKRKICLVDKDEEEQIDKNKKDQNEELEEEERLGEIEKIKGLKRRGLDLTAEQKAERKKAVKDLKNAKKEKKQEFKQKLENAGKGFNRKVNDQVRNGDIQGVSVIKL